MNYGYSSGGYASASVSVEQPSPYYVSSVAPEPLYEQMSASPGYGFVWIDGYWHWNGYEWVWIRGRWTRQQEGYVYVQPYYDYSGSRYVYQPGYWSSPDRIPRGWGYHDRGPGRPRIVAPPSSGPLVGRPGSGGYPPSSGPVVVPPPSSGPLVGRPPVYTPPSSGRPPVYTPPSSGPVVVPPPSSGPVV
ncbi:MAG TPA: hypothetical protein PKU97_21595, partial [Kofleriaceae bacterium]|nr:hypothetical protein [Kofleriaceae bacterium]